VWSRNTHDYDILLYVANWPKPRIAAWDTLLKARAIENMSYCVGVNRIGTDPNGLTYSGHSSVYDALGNQLVISENEEILELTLVKSKLVQTRTSLPFLEDRDTFNFLE
jgi:predicted amidohydrolase